jgi:hypothetical protein
MGSEMPSERLGKLCLGVEVLKHSCDKAFMGKSFGQDGSICLAGQKGRLRLVIISTKTAQTPRVSEISSVWCGFGGAFRRGVLEMPRRYGVSTTMFWVKE